MALEKSNIHLYKDICQVIDQARSYVAQTTNSTLTLMYWQIGDRINKELLDGERATYGKHIVSQLATKLQEQYGKRGFDEKNIRRMIQFAQIYPNKEIVVSLIRQLSWTHFIALITIKDDTQRDFYGIPPTNHILPNFKNLLTFVRKKKRDEFTREDVYRSGELGDFGRVEDDIFGRQRLQRSQVQLLASKMEGHPTS